MDIRNPFFKNVAALLAAVLFINPVAALGADLALDAAAGANTSLGHSGNGVPIVNIATPNSSGLSHNRFNEYNVGQQGLILNNATQVAQPTQLGGMILGNTNLNGRAAGLILNEVTGANPSQLKGYTEVAGQAAGVIVANPHGISCDGCGFINTPQVTLSTGKPVLEHGALRQFDVDQGEILIHGAGLNASNTDQFNLITRSARINAELHANELNIITGRNQVDATSLAATAKADRETDKPLLAVDSSALGGMYAGAIRLIGTEHGVGVRLASDMAASAGDIHIDANGLVSLERVASLGDMHIAAAAVDVTQGYAGGDVQIHSQGQINVAGSLASAGDQQIQAEQLHNHGIIQAGVALDGSALAGAQIAVKADEAANAGLILATGDVIIEAGILDNRSATLAAQGSMQVTADYLDNHDGQLVAENKLTVAADTADNSEGLFSAGQDMQLAIDTLDNRGGLIISDSRLAIKAVQVDNRAGQISAIGQLSLTAEQLNNSQAGTLASQADATLKINDELDNAGGTLVADAGLTLHADTLINTDGLIQATSGAMTLELDSHLNNTEGLLLAGDGTLGIKAETVENRGGLITSLKGLVRSASQWLGNRTGIIEGRQVELQVTDTLNNDLGNIIATGQNLKIDAQRISNMHGALFARQLLSIDAEQLNNNDSLLPLFLGSGDEYSLEDWIVFYRQMLMSDWDGFIAQSIDQGLAPFLGDISVTRQHELLALLDLLEQHPDALQQSSLIHAERVELDVDQLSQTVTSQVLADGDLQLTGRNWSNHGFMASDGKLDLTLTGHYDSYGTLASVDDLTVRAGSLHLQLGDEDIGGILGGSDVNVHANRIANDGQLTAMGNLQVEAGHIDNLGVLGAADQLQVRSDSLYNRFGLLFSGHNMLLQIDRLTNHDADIYSLGGLSLSGRDPARRAEQLDNLSGTIEAAGDMLLSVNNLNNRKEAFREEQVQLEGHMRVHCYDCSGDHHNVDYIAREVFESRIAEDSAPALLHSDSELVIDAGNVANHYSTLSSSGNMLIRANNVQNLGAVGAHTERTRTWNTGRTTDGTDERFRWNYITPYNNAALPRELPLDALSRYNLVSDISLVTALDANAPAVIQAGGNLLIQAAQDLHNSRQVGNELPAWHDDPTRNEIASVLQDIIKVQLNTQLPANLQQQKVNPLELPGFTLPAGSQGLFRLVQPPANGAPAGQVPGAVQAPASGGHRYLIETNPALTSLGQFLGSDYLLQRLGLNPDQTLKRLGDGLYEQRLVREAVTARTGARFLTGLTSDEAMYRYLMDNALASKEALGLSLGISLTAAQVAALTHDIVWLEEHEVMGEKVLVPVLYLAQAEGRLAPNGALIQGQKVTLISGGDLQNQGTLRSTSDLGIVATNINNAGLLSAQERLQLIAQDSIRNTHGGIISGHDVTLQAGGDILNERTATAYGNSRDGQAAASPLATIKRLLSRNNWQESGTILDSAAHIEAANDLNMQAGGNLANLGSVLQAGGDAELSAGQDLIIGSVEEHSSSMRQDRRNYWQNSQVTQHGSDVAAGGNLTASAGNDLAVIASEVEAGGDLTLVAEGNLVISAAANETHSEYRYRSSNKKITRENSLIEQQRAQLQAGGDVTLVAGQDLIAAASNIDAARQAWLVAGGQLALLSAEDLNHSFYEKKKKGSFGRKSFRSDQVTRITQQGTEITTGGDLALISGGDQTYQAANLQSGEDLTLTSGGGIAFEGVKDLHQESHEKSSSNWVWQSAKGKGNTDETLIQSQLIAQGELALRAAEGLQIDINDIDQNTISQTIDAMVEADPNLGWLKEMEQRGDVDWHLVKELHDSFSYSQSGLSGPAAMVIAIVVAYFTAGAASTLVAGMAGGAGASAAAGTAWAAATATTAAGWANVAVTAALTSAASGAAVSTINNGGDLGDVINDVLSEDAVKGYIASAITAGLTTGLFDNLTGMESGVSNTGGLVDVSSAAGAGLSDWSGVGQFAANQALQNTTAAVLNRAFGQEGNLDDVLAMTLANTFAAVGFNWVGDVGQTLQLDDGSLTKIGLHAIMGGLAAEAAGSEFRTGALVAGVNEALVDMLAQQYRDMEPHQRNGLLIMNSQVLGVLVAAAAGGDEQDMQAGSWVAGNATQYNYLTHSKLKEVQACLSGVTCESEEEKNSFIKNTEAFSEMLDLEMASVCSANATSDACRTAVNAAIQYVAMHEAWELMHGDVARSSVGLFDQIYNQEGAENWFSLYFNTVDNRADFFGASDRYEENMGAGAQWFGGAEFVTRAPLTGLGADGYGSGLTFALGSLLAGMDAGEIYAWRAEAGNTLIKEGFDNFSYLFNNSDVDPVAWDINQLRSEQQALQAIHDKYLLDKWVFVNAGTILTDTDIPYLGSGNNMLTSDRQGQSGGVDVTSYESRVNYGCKLLGYNASQGCGP